MTHPLLDSSFAAARKHLVEAREAQGHAIRAAIHFYRGGRLGRVAHYDFRRWDERRTAHLQEALRIRKRIHQLRAELRRFAALALEDTIPPHTAA